jgi:hypothetical protein
VGLDAFVHCRCWQDGLAVPPCAPDLVGFDEDGWLNLIVPFEGHEAAFRRFEDWKRDGCPHKGMRYANEHLSNWSGYRLFQHALREAGPPHLPTLLAELPNANGGQMSAEAAAAVLTELDHLTHHAVLGDDVVLVDEATGTVQFEYIAAYEGVMMLGPDFRAGVDPDGFFVLDPRTDPPTTLFRSTRFHQRVIDERRVEFTDASQAAAPAGRRNAVEIDMMPIGGHSGPPPRSLSVETRPRTAASFAYIVEPLRRLCQAAVATGNPVVWT